MLFAIIVAIAFAVGGVVLSFKALKKDEITQGLYGHVAFFLFMFSIGSLSFGSFVGIKGFTWNLLIFTTLGWIIIGRILTAFRLFKIVTYLHIIAGSITIIWTVINGLL